MKKLFIFLLLVFVGILQAQLSPGKLHRAHADLEGIENCKKCHDGQQELSSSHCLDCHKILAQEIKAGKGAHASSDWADCADCHVEHQGRDAELVYWKNGQDAFDHTLTGYKLEGKHSDVKCRDCHKAEHISGKKRLSDAKKDLGRTFIGLSQSCLSCHQNEHRGQLKETCLDCHTMQGWKPASQFDHNNADYKLTGLHKKVDCVKCHKINKNKPLKSDKEFSVYKPIVHQQCSNCHKDPHQNRLGTNCSGCHSTSGWQEVKSKNFDHDQTRYPLRGKHRTVKCNDCHKNSKKRVTLKYAACTDCHDNYHKGQFSKKTGQLPCSDCHTVAGFSPSGFTLERHQNTAFVLTGAHLAIPCIACHDKSIAGKKVRFRFRDKRCIACHKNPHGQEIDKFSKSPKQGGCLHCHTDSDWQSVHFDHGQTKFALEGRHLTTACTKCHLPESANRLSFGLQKKECQECHKDQHRGQFEKDNKTACRRCHTPKDWLAEKFNHDRDSRFLLKGAHRFVPCAKCHTLEREQGLNYVRYKPMDTTCKACHASTTNLKL